jgi:Ca2+-binding RTX toxin-like protein
MTRRLIPAVAVVMVFAVATAYATVIPPDRYPVGCDKPSHYPPNGKAVQAGAGDNTINGTPRRDLLRGGGGNDILLGREARDCLYGQRGFDVVLGSLGRDQLVGGTRADRLAGAPGRDAIKGGDGADEISGARVPTRSNGRRLVAENPVKLILGRFRPLAG